MRTFLRPNRSLHPPPHAAPTTQPTSRLEAATSVCSSDSANCCLRNNNAPLITAMSNPNSSPDVAATREAR